jgi:dihydrofolate reductase
MSKVCVFTNLTLDGVMQAPGRPDEDRRDGFEHGGWAAPFAAMQEAGGAMGGAGALLFGRRTYMDFYEVWPKRKDNPFTEILNAMPKYVASRTLKEPLPWMNSTLLPGEAEDAVAKLREGAGPDLLVFGSGVLVRSLMRRNLVDQYLLLIHPLVLGSGRRLFPDGGPPAALRLAESRATSKGVVLASYVPSE